jgi:hypothetical protein
MLSKIWVWDPGSGKNLFRIPDPGVKKAPDPGVKKAPDPGSGSAKLYKRTVSPPSPSNSRHSAGSIRAQKDKTHRRQWKSDLESDFAAVLYLYEPPPSPKRKTLGIQKHTYIYLFTQGRGGGVVLNQREGERGNRGEYRSQSLIENTNTTECTQKIGYLRSIHSVC